VCPSANFLAHPAAADPIDATALIAR